MFLRKNITRNHTVHNVVCGKYKLSEGKEIDLGFDVIEDTIQRIVTFCNTYGADNLQITRIYVQQKRGYIYLYFPLKTTLFSKEDYFLGMHWDKDDWDVQLEQLIISITAQCQ